MRKKDKDDWWCAEQYYLDTIKVLNAELKDVKNKLEATPKVTRDWVDLWAEHLTQQDTRQVSKLLRIILAELGVEVEK